MRLRVRLLVRVRLLALELALEMQSCIILVSFVISEIVKRGLTISISPRRNFSWGVGIEVHQGLACKRGCLVGGGGGSSPEAGEVLNFFKINEKFTIFRGNFQF